MREIVSDAAATHGPYNMYLLLQHINCKKEKGYRLYAKNIKDILHEIYRTIWQHESG